MRYGAEYAKWAPWTGAETESAMPTYGTALEFGGINESNDTLNFAEASAFGDNQKKINVKGFSSGTVTAKAVDQPIACGAAIMGNAFDSTSGVRVFSGDDNQPYGGYGFICNKMNSSSQKFYEVVFYPKVQGSPEGSSYKTKEDNVTLEYDSVAFSMATCAYRKIYKITAQKTTLEAAKTYLDGLFTGSSTIPDAVVNVESGS